jgi:iron complex outermembrane receptor protein
MRSYWLAGVSVLALGFDVATAQAADTASTAPDVSEIVVTGTHISGTKLDSALPVTVVTTISLEQQGSPSLVQLVKTLPGAYGSYGESNRLLGNVGGIASVNLRGFGAARTLVLLNGERLVSTVPGGGEDINLIPTAAIGRVEILKDGAATAYGSDAIAGVVNFITRRDLQGFEVNGNYSKINQSDGDYTLNGLYGWKWDRGDALITAGYLRRSELRVRNVGWAYQPGQPGFDMAHGAGGWSGASNPGRYVTGTAAQIGSGSVTGLPTFDDDGCLALGGATAAGSTSCRFHYSSYDNLVNDEFHYQLHGQLNFQVASNTDFHLEASWVRHSVPHEPFSPTQGTSNFPTPIAASGGSVGGGTSPIPAVGTNPRSFYYIPFSNPGLTQYYTTHCVGAAPAPAYCANLQNGVITSPTAWRAAGYGGNPDFADGANHQRLQTTAGRVASSLSGTINENLKWSVGVNFEQVESTADLPDLLVDRLQLSLRGLGGPNCNPATGTPGAGSCQYFNPFSNGIPVSKVNGATNPFYLGASNTALNNDPALFAWMMGHLLQTYTNSIATVDPQISGKLPIIALPGGPIEFAVGGQIRYNRDQLVTNTQANLAASPCPDSIQPNGPNCPGVGPYIFYPALVNYDVNSKVYALFAEFRLPITSQFSASAAVRYEKYSNGLSSTVPKFDAKWQPVSWFALRASAGKTLRVPTALQTTPGSTASLASFTNPVDHTALYRAVEISNDPNLQPETATTFDYGAIIEGHNFQFTVDYYKFDFQNSITSIAANTFYLAMFPSADPATWGCGNANLASHFEFVGGVCNPSNLLKVKTSAINGASVKTDGLDFHADYRFDDLFQRHGQLEFGADATYLMHYKQGPTVFQGITLQKARDYAGLVEDLASFYSNPKWRGNIFANYNEGRHNLRITARFQGGLKDVNLGLATVRDYYQLDAIYQLNLPGETQVTLGVTNMFDRHPSYVVSQYNYDYTTGNPLGRVINVGFKKHF